MRRRDFLKSILAAPLVVVATKSIVAETSGERCYFKCPYEKSDEVLSALMDRISIGNPVFIELASDNWNSS